MDRFFFDLYDDVSTAADEFGDEFDSAEEAGEQAIAILFDALCGAKPIHTAQRHGCRVRDAEGLVVYDVSMDVQITTAAVKLTD